MSERLGSGAPGRYPVTVEEYRAFAEDDGYAAPPLVGPRWLGTRGTKRVGKPRATGTNI